MIQKIRMDMSIGSNIQKTGSGHCKNESDGYSDLQEQLCQDWNQSYEYQSQRTGCSGQDSGLWSRRLFQRFKIKFHLSFVVIFSLPVVQFTLRFFYFKQKYSLSLRIHTWAHGNASVSESLSFTENVPYVEAHAQINCVRRCGNTGNCWFPAKWRL